VNEKRELVKVKHVNSKHLVILVFVLTRGIQCLALCNGIGYHTNSYSTRPFVTVLYYPLLLLAQHVINITYKHKAIVITVKSAKKGCHSTVYSDLNGLQRYRIAYDYCSKSNPAEQPD